jgi:hypothetical protein
VFFFVECFLTLGKVFAECPKKALGKEPFADEIFAECSLPSVTLGKAFAECKVAFAECLRHSAKNAIPVVHPLQLCMTSTKKILSKAELTKSMIAKGLTVLPNEIGPRPRAKLSASGCLLNVVSKLLNLITIFTSSTA